MSNDVYVLGVSMSNHDRSACLLKNGLIVGAIGEERLDRRKRSGGFYKWNSRGIVVPPLAAITYVLQKEGISLDRIDLLACGRSVKLCRDNLLEYLPVPQDRVVEPALPGHHLAHAYSAYGTSPFPQSAVLVIDEQGHHLPDRRFEKCSWFEGSNGPLTSLGHFMGHDDDLSLGMFYNAFAALTSLSEAANPAAGKLMGLAPFGKPHPEWPELILLDNDNGDTYISLHQLDEFFSLAGLQPRPGMSNMAARGLEDLARYTPVGWESDLAADLAFKAQEELEKAILHICTALRGRSSADTLSYAGGVALNCMANSRLLETGWADVYVQPAATDDGNAIGLAIYGWVEVLGNARKPVKIFDPFTGRRYGQNEVRNAVEAFGLQEYASQISPAEEAAVRASRGEVICWFQGASEWGPRALGARSILASPLGTGIKHRLNSTIKYREPFRPFAISATPSGLRQLVDCANSPASLEQYMLTAGMVTDVRLPEVRHVDGTVRYQLVNRELQPTFYQLIEEFGDRTGVYAILNTSFNTMGEPLVETPLDAVRQFLIADADVLVLETMLLVRSEIPEQTLDAARIKAWSQTPIDPLSTAYSLGAAGYLDAALKLLTQMKYDAEMARWEGPSAVQRYHTLLLRAAVQRDDSDAANHHAEVILRWSGLPLEAALAAHFMAEHSTDDEQRSMAGRLIAGVALQGSAFDFFTGMLKREDRQDNT